MKIDEQMLKGMMGLNDVFKFKVYLNPNQLETVKPDKKYGNICHIKTKGNRWFHLSHSVLEVQAIYCAVKNKKK